MITIRQPLSFSEIGRKDNQEDYLYPLNASPATRTFILCDGMGGHDNGEVASRTAAEALGTFLSSCSEIDIPAFEIGLEKAYEALDSIGGSSAKKPGTTMACLCLNEDSYLVAHIGDSRVYHIRPSLYNPKLQSGGILYQSSDHSLVNDLLKAGELTEEEARDFPQKNIITRAMQPLDKRYKADVYVFDDIREGDYFFLCCDGVLEQLTNTKLCKILADRNLNDARKLQQIKSICDGNTRDNYSCWLVPVDKVSVSSKRVNSEILVADMENPSMAQEEITADSEPSDSVPVTLMPPTSDMRNSTRRITNVLMVDILFIILAGLFLLWYAFMHAPAQRIINGDVEKTEQTEQSDGRSEKRDEDKDQNDQQKSSEEQVMHPEEALQMEASEEQTGSSSAKGEGKNTTETTENATKL